LRLQLISFDSETAQNEAEVFHEACAARLAAQRFALKVRSRRELDQLSRRTRFRRDELKMLYWGWKCLCPSGCLTEQGCKDIYAQFFPQAADSSIYATHVYRALFSRRQPILRSPAPDRTPLSSLPFPVNTSGSNSLPGTSTDLTNAGRRMQRFRRRMSTRPPSSAGTAGTSGLSAGDYAAEQEATSDAWNANCVWSDDYRRSSAGVVWQLIVPDKVTFTEYAHALSSLLRGTLQEKLAFAFHLYDVNMDGRVTQDEMVEMSRALYALLGKRSSGLFCSNLCN
jgi:Ca2+-binding EF-hand superfamily protein